MTSPPLTRRFGLLQATALNMINMIGIGPFITIPLLMTALGGPQAMLGWIVALVIVVCDGMVWSELGAAMPASGGSFGYLREAFGRETYGRLMAFLFVWQFILSGPLEIASGYIGFANYAGYHLDRPDAGPPARPLRRGRRRQHRAAVSPHHVDRDDHGHACGSGTMIATVAVIATGALHFDPRVAFDFPPGAFSVLARASCSASARRRGSRVYDYLGYYDVCYIGDEVKDPGRVIPRSIVISTAAVAVALSGDQPVDHRRRAVARLRAGGRAVRTPSSSCRSSWSESTDPTVASVFTLMILWTAFGSVFALLLGYSRIPYAAARDGYFLEPFGRLHPTSGFPHVSLLVLGAVSIASSFFSLGVVIDALIATRIVVQFLGQIAGVVLLRRRAPGMVAAVPNLAVSRAGRRSPLVGWLFIFSTTGARVMAFGLGVLALGVLCFLAWSLQLRQWPFRGAES